MLRSGRAAGRLLQLALGQHSNSSAFVPLSTQADGVLSAAIKQSFETNPQQASHAIAEALTPEQRAELLCSICKLQTKPLVDAKLADTSYVNSLFDKADSDCPKGLLSRYACQHACMLTLQPSEQAFIHMHAFTNAGGSSPMLCCCTKSVRAWSLLTRALWSPCH
jgi:hypothetical protein